MQAAQVDNKTAVVFAREEYDADAWSGPVMLRHWEELGHSPDLPLAPDFDMYQSLADANRLRIYTARVDEMLVGYAVFLLAMDLFRKLDVLAVCNLLYLHRAYRRGYTGSHLMKFADESLIQQDGVASISHAVSVNNASLSILLERMGYKKAEEIWARRVGR